MSDLVDPERIEEIVGVQRHPFRHMGRAVSAEQVVYILHSARCRERILDPRECEFSLALDRGIDLREWRQDIPVRLEVIEGRLVDHTVHVRRYLAERASLEGAGTAVRIETGPAKGGETR